MSQEYNLRKHYVNLTCAYYVMFIISTLCILIEKVRKITQDSTRKKIAKSQFQILVSLNLNTNFGKIFLNFNLFKIKNSNRNKNKL